MNKTTRVSHFRNEPTLIFLSLREARTYGAQIFLSRRCGSKTLQNITPTLTLRGLQISISTLSLERHSPCYQQNASQMQDTGCSPAP
ncbi:hypothetical protein AALO_G00144570 [Alosa alosa]|uniref:Uncharacterized protein n=1 Tax=Alosa alosa TaxID=278164 RepID=A0AAV6GK32_9TELE|nr:hypothetical protein AALO_G00144570 [Alosa alosa]